MQIVEKLGVPLQKCGGRTKKKEMGSKIIKTGKAKCGCALKKVGGRLIETDSCTGLPIHRTGAAIQTFKSPANPLGNVYVGYGSNFISTDPNHSFQGEKGNFGNLGDYQYYINRDGRNVLYAKGKDGKYYKGTKGFGANFLGVGGDNFNQWTELTGDDLTDEIRGYFGSNTPYATNDTGALYGSRSAATPSATTTTGGGTRIGGAGNMFSQALGAGDYSLNGRREWLAGADKEYLSSLGWDDARIRNYKGSAADNKALLEVMKGYGDY
jgi:hypothetical protein